MDVEDSVQIVAVGPAEPVEEEGPSLVDVSVIDAEGNQVTLPIRVGTPLRMVMAAACSRLNVQHAGAKFLAGGIVVEPENTLQELGLGTKERPAVLEVVAEKVQEAPGGGLLAPGLEVDAPGGGLLGRRPPTGGVAPDLEWTCPSCCFVTPCATQAVVWQPKLRCYRCCWEGFPELRQRWTPQDLVPVVDAVVPLSALVDHGEGQTPESDSAKKKKKKTHVKATSGAILEVDFVGQKVEVPAPEMLVLVTRLQRDKLITGLICYLFFCVNLFVIVTMAQPVGDIFEVQSSLHRELVTEAYPASAGRYRDTILDAATWDDVWTWVDTVLIAKAYEPSGNFTVGKYHRLLNAVRFRQARLKPTLPWCPRKEDGHFPDEFEMACLSSNPTVPDSCSTPSGSHGLSRPCWGQFTADQQEFMYPGPYQKETADGTRRTTRPEIDLHCLQTCSAYFVENKRTAQLWPPLSLPGVAEWVEEFGFLSPSTEKSLNDCQAACNVSGTSFMGGLSDFSGAETSFCGEPEGKTVTISRTASDGCWADIVDLPLEAGEARRLVAAMQRERWTGEATRMMAVELNFHNANVNLVTALRINVIQHPGGKLDVHAETWSTRLDLHSSFEDGIRLALEVLFTLWIVYFLLAELAELYEKKLLYFAELFNFAELTNLVLFMYTMVRWFSYCRTRDLSAFRDVSSTEFHDLYTTAREYQEMTILPSFNLVWGFCRAFKFARLSVKFRILWDTLVVAMRRMLPLLVTFLVALCAFTLSGHWIFGSHSRLFRTWDSTMMKLLLSINDGLDYAELTTHASDEVLPFVWSATWFVLSSLIICNFFVAIIIRAFMAVRKESLKQEEAEFIARQRCTLKLPSYVQFTLHELLPWTLGGKGTQERVAHETFVELRETLGLIDLEDLWARLLEGVLQKETALDATELSFLFRGNEKAARDFINRICSVGKLPDVLPPTEQTFQEAMTGLEGTMGSVGLEISDIQADLEHRFKEIRPLLRLEQSAKGGKKQAQKQAQDALTILKKAPAKKAEVPGEKSRAPNTVFEKPPKRGELSGAAIALHARRQQARRADGHNVDTTDLVAVPPDEINCRPDVGKFVKGGPLKRSA